MSTPVLVQLLHVPDCPLVERVRATLRQCLDQVRVQVRVEELEGSYPSPTLVVAGLDVVTGAVPRTEVCCRLDLPTTDQILAALDRST